MRKFIAPLLIMLALGASLAVVAVSGMRYSPDLTSAVDLWADVLRDVDSVGLTLTRVSDDTEIRLGTELAARWEPLVVRDEKANVYVNDIGQAPARHARRTRIPYVFKVIAGPPNAFSLPGGRVFITTGLLDLAEDEAEVAAVLAHEIAHVDLRHAIDRMQYELLLRRIAPADMRAALRVPYEAMILAYSEQMEREADRNGLMLMAEAGYHPRHAVTLLARQAKDHESSDWPRGKTMSGEIGLAALQALISFLQTHPPAEERVADTQRLIERNASHWRGKKFYVGHDNHRQLLSRRALEIVGEFHDFDEPPPDYNSQREPFDLHNPLLN